QFGPGVLEQRDHAHAVYVGVVRRAPLRPGPETAEVGPAQVVGEEEEDVRRPAAVCGPGGQGGTGQQHRREGEYPDGGVSHRSPLFAVGGPALSVQSPWRPITFLLAFRAVSWSPEPR